MSNPDAGQPGGGFTSIFQSPGGPPLILVCIAAGLLLGAFLGILLMRRVRPPVAVQRAHGLRGAAGADAQKKLGEKPTLLDVRVLPGSEKGVGGWEELLVSDSPSCLSPSSPPALSRPLSLFLPEPSLSTQGITNSTDAQPRTRTMRIHSPSQRSTSPPPLPTRKAQAPLPHPLRPPRAPSSGAVASSRASRPACTCLCPPAAGTTRRKDRRAVGWGTRWVRVPRRCARCRWR